MLNLLIAMFKSLLILSVLFFAQTAEPSILSPQAGQTLRGQVQITGNLNIPNFASAELAFSYASNPTDTLRPNSEQGWFTIQKFSQPVTAQTLAIWDTTLLTDGDYILHLRVTLQDGTSQDISISDLKIRNDESPVTDTPAPAEESSSLLITATPIPTINSATAAPIFPTPASLPSNPASVTSTSIYSYFARGGGITLVLFAFFALILRLRKN